MKTLLIGLIRIYQIVFSPLKILAGGPCCRFSPSCSHYAIGALREHGALWGSWLAARRLCRCHPWGGFGLDPVPPKREPQWICRRS